MENEDCLMRLYELLEKEITRIADKGDMTPAELENASKAVCLMEKIEKMTSMDGHSEMDYPGYSYEGSYGHSYMNDMRSGRRGRSPVTGRYVSRDGRSMKSEEGRSGHSIKDRMISRLEHMMDETNSDYERDEISSYIRKLETVK